MRKVKKVAIFGASGYIGSSLLKFLSELGVGCDVFDLPRFDVTSITFWELFNPDGYDTIFYFVGLAGPVAGFNQAEQFTAVNEVSLLSLCNKLAQYGKSSPKIIFPSSRLVYKGSEQLLSEDSSKEPLSVYAVNKLAGEAYLKAYNNFYSIPYSVLRAGNPYGTLVNHKYSHGTIGFFLRQVKDFGAIKLYGSGDVLRTFIHIEDLCQEFYSLACIDESDVFNCDGEALTLIQVAQRIASVLQCEIFHCDWPEDDIKVEVGNSAFDSGKIRNRLKLKLKHSFNEWVESLTGGIVLE